MADDVLSTPSLFEAGVAAHRGGRLAAARTAYEAVLAREPRHFDALHMLGVVAVQSGDAERGAALIEQALVLAPNVAGAHVNHAVALTALGRHEAALAAADRAIALAPGAEAHTNRGNALLALASPAEALAAYEQALALQPNGPQAHYNHANALRDLGRLDEALAGYDAAVALAPTYFEALSNRAAVLVRLGRLEAALASHEAAASAHRTRPEAWLNRGAVLGRLGRFAEALASYDTALALDPANPEGHCNRSGVLNNLARPAEAIAAADRALAVKPGYADALSNKGIALYDQRDVAGAISAYDAALAVRPDFAEAHMNRSLASLLAGDLVGGFAEYRWRWEVGDARRVRAAIPCPDWEGEPLAGERLLVLTEQGFGDTLQFARFLPRLTEKGAQVTLLAEPPLLRLLTASFPQIEVVDRLPAGAAHDFQVGLLCLPRLTGVSQGAIPGQAPYLVADLAAAALWTERLARLPGRKVGLVWAGASRRDDPFASAIDARRSVRLAQLAPLAAASDVTFVSLQLGDGAAEAAAPPPGLALTDWTPELRDFADTAALVAGLDLVITVDTSVAHLAGALGRPVWILSRYDGCWRWLLDRDDSPWYPTARLFRQTAPGAWDEVIGRVAAALADIN